VGKYGKHTLGSGGVHTHLEVHASLMQCMKLQRNFHRNQFEGKMTTMNAGITLGERESLAHKVSDPWPSSSQEIAVTSCHDYPLIHELLIVGLQDK
jgi:hypothetical protein